MSNAKVVLITGVSSGIGRKVAEKFVAQGCRVYGTVRSIENTQAIQGAVLVQMDIRDEGSIAAGVQKILSDTKGYRCISQQCRRHFTWCD